MSKVMLVEDDNNLREIYEARLQAEGYTIFTAHDGEEALVVAKNEQPDLIISDVMMPKISGFEMLDILRNTDGLKDVKVIMLTALGQSDDQQRADRLGADSYLVKSQVTLEDIVKVAGRLLGNEDTSADVASAVVAAPVVDPAPVVVPAPPVAPTMAVAEPVVTPTPPPLPEPEPSVPLVEALVPVAEPVTVAEPVAPVAFGAPAPVTPAVSEPIVEASAAAVPTADAAFLQSLGASSEATPIPAAQPLAEEAATVEAQIASFEKASGPAPDEVEPMAPAVNVEPPAPATEVAAPMAPEQFVTTAPPDLTTTVDPTAPTAQSAGNDDVLADALQSLTGQPPEAIIVTAVPPLAEVAASADQSVARGGNRVITPLDTMDKPDLSTLLALEEAKEIANAPLAVPAANTTVAATMNSTAPAIVPAAAPAAQAPVTTQPFDPNNIAL